MTNIKKGVEFTHKHWLADAAETGQATPTKMLCRVTRVSQGTVYWREVNQSDSLRGTIGGTMHFPLDDVERQVGKIVEPAA